MHNVSWEAVGSSVLIPVELSLLLALLGWPELGWSDLLPPSLLDRFISRHGPRAA